MTATAAAAPPAPLPLVAHVINRLTVGGMENGLVNILNHPLSRRYRHAVICLRAGSDFRARLRNPQIAIHCLDKQEGKDPGAYLKLYRLLRRLGPDIVHTRNLPALDMVVPAMLAGVPVRIHGEHGRDAIEENGRNLKYNLLRRVLCPLTSAHVAVSRDIQSWLTGTIGVPARRVVQIYNGVDAARFRPPSPERPRPRPPGFDTPGLVVFGTVGRMETVKDQPVLARAFVRLVQTFPQGRQRLRLVMAGDGPLKAECEEILTQAGLSSLAWLPGLRDDIPEIMRMLDVFVLPSRTEGISNTILEAMATGLPVVATNVGGNPELIRPGLSGALVPPSDPEALADALAVYAASPTRRRDHGRAARAVVEREFDLSVMVGRYLGLYDRLLAGRVRAGRAPAGNGRNGAEGNACGF